MEADISSSWITIESANGGSFNAFVSLPPSGFGPGLMVLQEIYGVNEHIRSICEQFALDGFVAVAPDIFWRQESLVDLSYDDDGLKKGLNFFSNLNINLAAADLQRTVEAIRHIPSCSGKVGSVGFCMGGLLSFVAAARAGVETSVSYYATRLEQHSSFIDDITCPILFHFAENDQHVDSKVVREIERSFQGKDCRIVVHKNANHGFNCWKRQSWDQAASAKARGQTLVHLMESLA